MKAASTRSSENTSPRLWPASDSSDSEFSKKPTAASTMTKAALSAIDKMKMPLSDFTSCTCA